jgi:hypothetical protein
MYEFVLRNSKVIDVGERNIVIATKDYGRGKPRFIINLPTTRNDLWQYLWKNKITVKVFIELPEETLKLEDVDRESSQRGRKPEVSTSSLSNSPLR